MISNVALLTLSLLLSICCVHCASPVFGNAQSSSSSSSAMRVRCFERTLGEWSPELSNPAHGMYAFRSVDVLGEYPLWLSIENIQLSGTRYDRCSVGSMDAILLQWATYMEEEEDGSDSNNNNNTLRLTGRATFSYYPVHCQQNSRLFFGVSSLGAKRWGSRPRHVHDGAVFAPRQSEVDMLTTVSARHSSRSDFTPPRERVLIVATASGSERELLGSPTIKTCVWEHDLQFPVRDYTKAWWHEWATKPRLLPFVTCVRQYGSNCGADLGYVNTLEEEGVDDVTNITLAAHSPLNTLHPSSLENGFTLPSVFTAGVHHSYFDDEHHMHVGWACDYMGGGEVFVEARWHLDSFVLHLGRHTRRCNDDVADPMGGGYDVHESDSVDPLSFDADAQRREQHYRAKNDRPLHFPLKPQHPEPIVYHVPAEVAARRWRDVGVEKERVSVIQQAEAQRIYALMHPAEIHDAEWRAEKAYAGD
jgi:hypothetical protein